MKFLKSIGCLIIFLLIGKIVVAQTADEWFVKANVLYKDKKYTNAAAAYTEGIKLQGKEPNVDAVVRGASSWALSNVADSAFYLLNLLTKSTTVSQGDSYFLKVNKDFLSIQYDDRWNPLTKKIESKAASNYPIKEIIYGRKDGLALTMLQLNPSVKSNGKAIIRVIAGSWYSSYQNAEYSIRPSTMYREKGYTVFLVIIGSNPRYPIPSQIDDIKRAVRYIRYNAASLKIDPNHLGIEGSSAGGHLSLAVATADENINIKAMDPIDRVSSRVQAVTVLFPPTDVLNWGGPGISFVNIKSILLTNKIYGALDFKELDQSTMELKSITDTSARNKIARSISPIYAVSSDDPPIFIIHGTADLTVPLQQSVTFVEKLKEAGVPNKFIIKQGGGHNPNDMQPDMKQFVDWFDKYLK